MLGKFVVQGNNTITDLIYLLHFKKSFPIKFKLQIRIQSAVLLFVWFVFRLAAIFVSFSGVSITFFTELECDF